MVLKEFVPQRVAAFGGSAEVHPSSEISAVGNRYIDWKCISVKSRAGYYVLRRKFSIQIFDMVENWDSR